MDQDEATVEKVFSDIDKDNDGFINKKELQELLKTWKVNVTESELDDMMNDIDTNKDGKIDLKEFKSFMAKGGLDSSATLKQTFKLFDSDGDGYITEAELTQTLKKLGQTAVSEQVAAIMKDADIDKDGKISFKEFQVYFQEQSKRIATKSNESKEDV